MWIFPGNYGCTKKIFHRRYCDTKVGEPEKYSSAQK